MAPRLGGFWLAIDDVDVAHRQEPLPLWRQIVVVLEHKVNELRSVHEPKILASPLQMHCILAEGSDPLPTPVDTSGRLFL